MSPWNTKYYFLIEIVHRLWTVYSFWIHLKKILHIFQICF